MSTLFSRLFSSRETLRPLEPVSQEAMSWRFELTQADFDDLSRLRLKPERIEQMACALVRDSLDKPGFVFVPNIHAFAASKEAAWQFQLELVQAVYNIFEQRVGLDMVAFSVGDVVIVDRGSCGRVGQRGGKGLGSLHFDGGIDQLVSFMYHSSNVTGGRPMVGDPIRYMADRHDTQGLQFLAESDPRFVIRADKPLSHRDEQKILPFLKPMFMRWLSRSAKRHPLKSYHRVIADPVFENSEALPIIIVNNRRIDGVAHTGTPVHVRDAEQPAGRILRQVFIRTDLIPDQKIILVGPPPNEVEKSLLPASVRHRFEGLSPDSVEHHHSDYAG